MKANINVKITYDDLSEACKEKLKRLEKELDCTVNLIYPDITSTPNIGFGKTYPYTPGQYPDVVLCNEPIHGGTSSTTTKWKPNTNIIGKIQCPDGSIKSTSIHSQS